MNRFSLVSAIVVGILLAIVGAVSFAQYKQVQSSRSSGEGRLTVTAPAPASARRGGWSDCWNPRSEDEANWNNGRWEPSGLGCVRSPAPGPSDDWYDDGASYSWQSDAFPAYPWPYFIQNAENDEGEPYSVVCVDDADCVPRPIAARLYSEAARYWLLRGDAELTRLELDCGDGGVNGLDFGCQRSGGRPIHPQSRQNAMRYWNQSVAWGRPFGAQSSILAQRRLQAHLVDCPVTQDSLSRIARDPRNGLGDVIGLNLRQAALAALGYYTGPIDGAYGAETRRAVRAFQRELGYDETASLTPRQTAQLMCHAAQTARDPSVQNVLGIMHAVGLGVVQNTDLALEWLEMAAVRGDADANFNLAVIYGTGAVFGSYRLCAIVENPERADAYLRDAAELGHGVARRFRSTPSLSGAPSAQVRWARIREAIEEMAPSESTSGEILRNAARARVTPTTSGCLDANASR